MKIALTFFFGLIMVAAGINHFIHPNIYDPFIPDFLPKLAVNYLTGIAEFALGAGVFVPRLRPYATLGILVMMILFLPLHFLDVFRENPAIGSRQAALIRLPLQFVLIWWAWVIWRPTTKSLKFKEQIEVK